MPVRAFAELRGIEFNDAICQQIDEKVRGVAYTIIAGKGATYYGIGSALSRIVKVILHDQRSILTVCAPSADVAGVPDVTVALPRLVGGDGIMETFSLPLDDHEFKLLSRSAYVIRHMLEGLEAKL
jgi:L-lactate dehydrogenase